MTKPVSLESALLLNAFVQIYDTIIRDGVVSEMSEKDSRRDAGVKRLGPIYAVPLAEDVRALGLLECGMVVPFAKVNGKGVVEPVGNTRENLMVELVKRGVHPAKSAVTKEEPMMHYGITNIGPVFPGFKHA